MVPWTLLWHCCEVFRESRTNRSKIRTLFQIFCSQIPRMVPSVQIWREDTYWFSISESGVTSPAIFLSSFVPRRALFHVVPRSKFPQGSRDSSQGFEPSFKRFRPMSAVFALRSYRGSGSLSSSQKRWWVGSEQEGESKRPKINFRRISFGKQTWTDVRHALGSTSFFGPSAIDYRETSISCSGMK